MLARLSYNALIPTSSRASVLAAGGAIRDRQWEYPAIWPIHQILIWLSCLAADREDIARELAGTWLRMGLDVYNQTGFIMEKNDCEQPGVPLGTEYGTVIDANGFGWSDSCFLVGAKIFGIPVPVLPDVHAA